MRIDTAFTPAIGLSDVRQAAERLRGVANRTPVVTSRTVDAIVGGQVFFKCENLQRGGAFKFRGAYNRLVALSADERARGVVAFSSGNHAQGVALAARELGVRATIVMPTDAPELKLAATQGYGAEVVTYDHLIARGTMAACRDHGEVRLEGKEYTVQDGDIINFRFAT